MPEARALAVMRFLGPDDRNDRVASPAQAALGPQTTPFLVAYGTRDFPHLITQGVAFANAVRQAGASVRALPMQDRTHFTASQAGGEKGGPWVPAALDFMRATA